MWKSFEANPSSCQGCCRGCAGSVPLLPVRSLGWFVSPHRCGSDPRGPGGRLWEGGAALGTGGPAGMLRERGCAGAGRGRPGAVFARSLTAPPAPPAAAAQPGPAPARGAMGRHRPGPSALLGRAGGARQEVLSLRGWR